MSRQTSLICFHHRNSEPIFGLDEIKCQFDKDSKIFVNLEYPQFLFNEIQSNSTWLFTFLLDLVGAANWQRDLLNFWIPLWFWISIVIFASFFLPSDIHELCKAKMMLGLLRRGRSDKFDNLLFPPMTSSRHLFCWYLEVQSNQRTTLNSQLPAPAWLHRERRQEMEHQLDTRQAGKNRLRFVR